MSEQNPQRSQKPTKVRPLDIPFKTRPMYVGQTGVVKWKTNEDNFTIETDTVSILDYDGKYYQFVSSKHGQGAESVKLYECLHEEWTQLNIEIAARIFSVPQQTAQGNTKGSSK